ncbi:hypothetical protein [Desulfonatronovibrio magnus]|uniref:hypothetical protein n=1 Tax=Desulfonatronovibrio magnus TaxID=698827 RepID=UPI0005EB8B71|nr:hypothetical protein [Desulfonatronovibrio magnus]
MVVKDIDECLKTYNNLFGSKIKLKATYSDPWNPLRGEDIFYELNYQCGIYIYSECKETDWNIPLTENMNEIWYIGKTIGSIRGRIWKNIANDSKELKKGDPKFKNHRWTNDPNVIGTPIDTVISMGDFNVYAIPIKSENEHFPPEIIETYLLCCYYKSQGRLPILNSIISQYKPKR